MSMTNSLAALVSCLHTPWVSLAVHVFRKQNQPYLRVTTRRTKTKASERVRIESIKGFAQDDVINKINPMLGLRLGVSGLRGFRIKRRVVNKVQVGCSEP